MQRAYHYAMQGRPGPVVIALPEDVLTEIAEVADAPRAEAAPIWPGLTQMAELQKRLWAAERPLVIVGGPGWTEKASASVLRFAERFDLPVAAQFRRASALDGEHPNYCGEVGLGINPKLKARARERRPRAADRRPHVGGGVAGLYAARQSRRRGRRSIHVHADPHEIGRNYAPTLGIVATSPAFAAALGSVQPPTSIPGARRRAQARADYLAWSEQAPRSPGAVQPAEIMLHLRRRVPDAIFTTGAGNFALWVNRFLRFRSFEQQLGPTGGSMGFGLPAAIAAKQLYPDRVVVAFAGDGDFLMNGQEFATAVQYDVAVIVDRDRQWPIRHDPHASGARISRPRRRHAIAQPGFRGAMPAPSAATARRF